MSIFSCPPSVGLSFHLSIFLSVSSKFSISVYLDRSTSRYLCISLCIDQSMSPEIIDLSICLLIYFLSFLSVCLLSVCLSIYLLINLCLYFSLSLLFIDTSAELSAKVRGDTSG
jgi:hypothetical protein